MTYNFKIVKERFRKLGWTYREWSDMTKPTVHYASIFRMLKTGKAQKSTARAIIKPLGITYEKILPKERKSA